MQLVLVVFRPFIFVAVFTLYSIALKFQRCKFLRFAYKIVILELFFIYWRLHSTLIKLPISCSAFVGTTIERSNITFKFTRALAILQIENKIYFTMNDVCQQLLSQQKGN